MRKKWLIDGLAFTFVFAVAVVYVLASDAPGRYWVVASLVPPFVWISARMERLEWHEHVMEAPPDD